MKEMEVVHKTREAEKAAELSQRLARLEGEEGSIAPPGLEVSLPDLLQLLIGCQLDAHRFLLARCLQDHHLVALLPLLEGFYQLNNFYIRHF